MIGASLFSGIGAPETAVPHWRWPWHAEIERFPSAVMAQRHPESVNLGDVTADDFAERALAIARPDVLVFGSPCQSFSVAGKRLGLDDPRGNLALVALGIVARLEPRWIVFENVPGLLSSAEGCDFGLLLRAVDDLGYSGAWAMLDAQHFGLAQRRERLFLVASSGDWRGPAAVLLEPEGLCGDHPPRRQAGQGTAPTLAARTKGGGGLGTDFDCDGGLIAHALRADGFDASEDGTGRGCPIVPIAFESETFVTHANAGGQLAVAVALRGREGGGTAELSELPSALRASTGGGDKAHVLTAFDIKGVLATNGASETDVHTSLRARKPGQSEASTTTVIHQASAVRRLTPRECERLQGYPDDYTAIEYRGKPAADGPRYKALGNSMAVPVMRWILARIERLRTGVHVQ